MEYLTSYTDSLQADIQPSYINDLMHFGIKGMKWGVRRYQNPDGSYTAEGKANRKQLSKIDRKYDRLAQKDAKEYARAKMSYGEGAGNRRKLIKNKVAQRRKENKHYDKMFDTYLNQQDMSKHADAAKRERVTKDTVKTTKRAARTAFQVYNTVAPLLHDDSDDAFLEHHGIKGMRWGIRRYQNEDGTLTAAGKKRYANTNRMYKDLKKQVRKQRGKQNGFSNRYMTVSPIGEHSMQYLNEAREKRKQYENSDEYKQWIKKVNDYERKSQTSYDKGDITLKEYDDGWKKLNKERPRKNYNDPYDAAYIVNRGKHYSDSYIKGGGRDLSIAYLRDLGYSESVAKQMVNRMIKADKTLGFI